MRKIKPLMAAAMASAILFSGCSASEVANRAMGNVTQESVKADSMLTYGTHTVSEKTGRLNLLLGEFQQESVKASSGVVDPEMWSQKPNEAAPTTLEQQVKESLLQNMKETLVLSSHAEDFNVSLSKEEEQQIEDVVGQQLGQTYKNVLVEYFESKNFTLDAETLKQMMRNEVLANKVRQAGVEKQNVDVDYGKVVEYRQIILPVKDSAETTKATADKMLKEAKDGKSFDDLAKENNLTADTGVISEKDTQSAGLPEDIAGQILALDKDNIQILKYKTGDTVGAYMLVQVIGIDTDEAKKKVSEVSSIAQSKKQEAFQNQIAAWVKDVYVNQAMFDSVHFEYDADFWNKYKKPAPQAPANGQ